MKKIAFLIVFACIAGFGCSRPKEIPDKKLEAIFKEIFLVNAYVNSHTIHTDSLDIYEPILEKYGYKARDLTYTLGQFSRRKSSRLSSILDASIAQLTAEYEGYERRVAVLDTIDNVARERFREIVHTDTLLQVRSLKDTARLRLEFPAREGQYRIKYAYLIDTTDKNYSLRAAYTLRDSAGKELQNRTNWLQRARRIAYDTRLEAPAGTTSLEIHLANYTKTSSSPGIRIDTLEVIYYLPLKVALDSLSRSLVDYKLFIDGKEYRSGAATDSLALRTDPPRAVAPADSIP